MTTFLQKLKDKANEGLAAQKLDIQNQVLRYTENLEAELLDAAFKQQKSYRIDTEFPWPVLLSTKNPCKEPEKCGPAVAAIHKKLCDLMHRARVKVVCRVTDGDGYKSDKSTVSFEVDLSDLEALYR